MFWLQVRCVSPSRKPKIGNCPVLEIPGFTYPVSCYYLDDVLPMLANYHLPDSNKRPNWRKLVEEGKLVDEVDIQLKTIDENKTEYGMVAAVEWDP